MDHEFYKINPSKIFLKITAALLICFSFVVAGCSQKVNPGATNNNATHCTDSAIAYRQVILPGVQKTDLDGNIIQEIAVQYRIFLFSSKETIVIDSVKIGKALVTKFATKVITEKPLYRGSEVLVGATDCFVQEITATENIQGGTGEDKAHEILLYYPEGKTTKQITIKRSTTLPQAVVE